MLEQMNTLKNLKWYIAGSVGLVLVGLLAVNHAQSKALENNLVNIKVLNDKIADTDSQRLSALNAKDEATAWANAANERVKTLEIRLASKPYPPKPAPAPQTNPELESVLVKFGLGEGLGVVLDTPSRLAHADALKVYDWASEAARVAPLEDRVSAQGALIDGMKIQVNAEQIRADKTGEALTITTKQLALTQEEAKLLSKRVTLTESKSKVQKILWGAAGLGVGYLTGKALK
jgi:uncharacterized coiled-coil protein SlyX